MKLLKVTADNFKMCSNNFSISFVPTGNKTKDDKEFELHELDDNLYVYTTLGIIGKNASGKTTAVELLSIVYDIISNYRIKNSINIFKFIDDIVKLDIYFYHTGYLYRYITQVYKKENSVDDTTILFRNQKLYKKEYKKSYSKNIFDENTYDEIDIKVDLPEDTSIIYLILKDIELRGIYCSSDDNIYKDYANTFNMYKLINNNYDIISSILKLFDEHLFDIEMVNKNKFRIKYVDKEVREVSSDELYQVLSSGTTKGFGLFTFVVYSLKTGSDLIIDEIENHFHKTLVENLVNLYKDKTVNRKNASLIFTTHYCELLDLFNRTDNIYISKFNKKIELENMYENYNFRPELSKSRKFYDNAFNTDVNYEVLMEFKKELLK